MTQRPEKPRWMKIGYYLTFGWIGLVLLITHGNRAHPLFDLIFTVPIVAWILAVLIAKFVFKSDLGLPRDDEE